MTEHVLVNPWTVVIDTREQAPYTFQNILSDARHGRRRVVVKTVRRALTSGDYSVDGMDESVGIERKELGDFFHCVGSDRDRFERQLDRLNSLDFGAVVVEADWLRILRGHLQSQLSPKTVFRSVIAWQMNHFPSVHWWFAPGRRFAELYTFRALDRFWRTHKEG